MQVLNSLIPAKSLFFILSQNLRKSVKVELLLIFTQVYTHTHTLDLHSTAESTIQERGNKRNVSAYTPMNSGRHSLKDTCKMTSHRFEKAFKTRTNFNKTFYEEKLFAWLPITIYRQQNLYTGDHNTPTIRQRK